MQNRASDSTTARKYYFNPSGSTPGAVGSNYGVLMTGLVSYFNGSGLVTTGWASIGGSKYYFNGSGVMQTGWMTVKKNKYYLDPSTGKMTKGWAKVGSKTYFFNTTTGAMKKGWLKYKKKKYYLNPKTGVMTTGLKKISGTYYFFNKKNGVMKRNGAQKISGKLYYFQSSGKARMKKGWFKGADGKSATALGKGVVATGKKKIGSNWYVFSTTNGAVTKVLGDDIDKKVQANPVHKQSGCSKPCELSGCVFTPAARITGPKSRQFDCAIGADATPTPTGTIQSQEGSQEMYTTVDGVQTRYWFWCYYNGKQGIHSGLYYDGGPNDGKDYDTRVDVKSTNGGIRVNYSNASGSTTMFL